MKVSSKIILGFFVLMMLAIVVLANQLAAIHQMQTVNRELSEINVMSATTVLRMQKLADLLGDDSKKYFAALDPLYDHQISGFRNDFIEDLRRLRVNLRAEKEQTATAKLTEAIDEYWTVFNALKEQGKAWDPDELPPDLTLAVNHLQAQADVMLDAVQLAIKERVAAAA